MENNRIASSDAQMKKGVLEMCVLHMIRNEPTYGYDIMKSIGRHFPEVNESTIYAILRRLYADGCASCTTNAESGGPPRKYYQITPEGAALLDATAAAWRRINVVLNEMGL